MTSLRRSVDLALALLLLVVVATTVAAAAAPLAGARLLAVRSGSMTPAIPVGALVVVEGTGAGEIGARDIVTIRQPNGAFVTHRVVRALETEDGRRFELRGDANARPDPVLVSEDQLVGRVVGSLAVLGVLFAMLSMPSGILAVASTIGCLIVVAWLLEDLETEAAQERAMARRLSDPDAVSSAHAPAMGVGGDGF